MSHRTNTLVVFAIDLAPTGKTAFAAELHDRADQVETACWDRS
ncbi:hypothetical protein ACH40F_29135 [Streptomyces sp. NPDC020794]